MKRSIIFYAEGGMGKCIAATAVVRSIRKTYPDDELVVVSPHPYVFRHNPNVDKVLIPGTDIYSRIVLDRDDFVIHKVEPYHHVDYIRHRRHMTDVWCEMIGVPYDGSKPDLYLTGVEKAEAKAFAQQFSKPILLMQITGGPDPSENTEIEQIKAGLPMQKRDLDIAVATKVVAAVKDQYDVVQIKKMNQPGVDGAKMLTAKEPRFLFAIIPQAAKLLLTDSFMQHATAAFDKPSVVCWCGTSPDVLGYECHTNLRQKVCDTPECHRPNTSLSDFNAEGAVWECPVGEVCRKHPVEKILEALQVKKESMQLIGVPTSLSDPNLPVLALSTISSKPEVATA